MFEAVAAQAAMIRDRGGEAVVFGLMDRHAAEDSARFAPSPVEHGKVLGPAQIGFSLDLPRMLIAAELDCLHLHGIWMYPSRAGYLWRRRTGRPYLISPHGMLDPWITARGRWKKALARAGYERTGWQVANAFHALTRREARDIEAESGRSDSVVIANPGPAASARPLRPRDPHVLCLGRVHPKKNIAALVAAWSELAASGALPDQARLTIAGWGEDAHVAELRATLAQAPGSIEFVGPVYGEAKQHLLDQAQFVALPSFSEGLPMVVLEAWAAGTPVLMTQECNLPEGFAAGAALDCGYDTASIAACLAKALTMADEDWLGMANAAVELARGPFAEATIADRWAQTYAGLIAQSRRAAQ